MKKLLIIIPLLFVLKNLQAQKYSIEGRFMNGVHWFSYEQIFPKNHFQINGGIYLKKVMNNTWGLTTGIQSRILNRKEEYDVYFYGHYAYSYTTQTRFDYIEIPINSYFKWRGLHIEGGTNINYLMKYQFRIDDELDTSEKPEGMTFMLGLNTNIGYQFDLNEKIYLILSAYYDYPILLSNPFETSLMNYGIYMGIGYEFSN